MDWRREDTGYAGAVVVAAALLGYLVAGNLGLVPTPVSSGVNSNDAAVAPASISVAQSPEDIIVAVAPMAPDPQAATPPRTIVIADLSKPVIDIATQSGAVLGVANGAAITGTVTDVGSGVNEVLVTFIRDNGKTTSVPAKLACDGAHAKCTWSVEAPAVLGRFEVKADASDAAGNTSSSSPIDFAVVNTGSAVEDVVDVVGRVPDVLGNVVGSVLGLLGLAPR